MQPGGKESDVEPAVVKETKGRVECQPTSEPSPDDYNLPSNDDEMTDMIEKMKNCGMSAESAVAEIKKRKKQYEAAIKKFVIASKKSRNMPKRNSLNADM